MDFIISICFWAFRTVLLVNCEYIFIYIYIYIYIYDMFRMIFIKRLSLAIILFHTSLFTVSALMKFNLYFELLCQRIFLTSDIEKIENMHVSKRCTKLHHHNHLQEGKMHSPRKSFFYFACKKKGKSRMNKRGNHRNAKKFVNDRPNGYIVNDLANRNYVRFADYRYSSVLRFTPRHRWTLPTASANCSQSRTPVLNRVTLNATTKVSPFSVAVAKARLFNRNVRRETRLNPCMTNYINLSSIRSLRVENNARLVSTIRILPRIIN